MKLSHIHEALDRNKLRDYLQQCLPDDQHVIHVAIGFRDPDKFIVDTGVAEYGSPSTHRLIIHVVDKTLKLHNLETKQWHKIDYTDLDEGIKQIFQNLEGGFQYSTDIGTKYSFESVKWSSDPPQDVVVHDDTEAGKLQIGGVQQHSDSEWFYDIHLVSKTFDIDGMPIVLTINSQIGTDSIPEYDYTIFRIGEHVGNFKPLDRDLDKELRRKAGELLQSTLYEPQVAKWIRDFHENYDEQRTSRTV